MKKTMTLLTGLAVALSAFTLIAQPGPPDGSQPPPGGPPDGPGGGGRRPPPPSPLIGVLDANHDHVIDAAEIANAPAALKTLDKNGDGKLTPDEYMPPRRGPGGRGPGGPPPGVDGPQPPLPPPPPIVAALDANHDGVIDADEIANASAALLTLDKNHDGKLTPEEFRPPWAGPHGPRGGRGPWSGQQPPAQADGPDAGPPPSASN